MALLDAAMEHRIPNRVLKGICQGQVASVSRFHSKDGIVSRPWGMNLGVYMQSSWFSTQNPVYYENQPQHFALLSKKWWDAEGPFKSLHDFNPVRLDYIVRHCMSSVYYGKQQAALNQRRPQGSEAADSTKSFSSPLLGLDVLDVGCGGGLLSEAMAIVGGANVLGIDTVQEGVQIAADHFARTRDRFEKSGVKLHGTVEYTQSTVEAVAARIASQKAEQNSNEKSYPPRAAGGPFDLVVASETIEHVKDPKAFLGSLIKCLKPNGEGTLVVTTLNKTPESYLFAILIAEKLAGIVPDGTHSWDSFISPANLVKWGESREVRHLDTKGICYVPGLRIFVTDPLARIQYMAAFRST